jgi:hypothetical protein
MRDLPTSLSRDYSMPPHIIMDADEQLGQPIVSNGLPLTKSTMPPSTPN